MALTISLKGKKRAIESSLSSTPSSPLSPTSSVSEPPHPTKRAKRAETRQCPVCDEHIPLRLLSRHVELESERVEDVIKKVGSSDITYDEMDDGPGPSSRVRRSALKARKSLTTRNVHDSLEQAGKAIQAVKRRRKQRHTKLKEMAREEEEGNSKDSWSRCFTGEAIVCPVCLSTVRGDQDVVDAHVDSCLANESRRREEARMRELRHQRAMEEEVWENGEEGSYPGHIGSVRGTGFHTRDRDQQDIEEEIDIDGDDQAVFGDAQFTEGDIIPINEDVRNVDEDVDIDIEGDEVQQEQIRLRELVAAGKLAQRRSCRQVAETGRPNAEESDSVVEADKTNMAIISARQRGDKAGLILALESKVTEMESCRTPAVLCRICLEPYSEPTASTGCWHTCCRLCWLKCLGTTKLCPICKRITGATDLRRIYI
ncbi:hypothetical protein BYT27DRAFT_7191688 [Phlegmacium glaucopus]|nr:hypothetical protein BYT27DRAFT_7191688 [Phlegmacium glaucopus]